MCGICLLLVGDMSGQLSQQRQCRGVRRGGFQGQETLTLLMKGAAFGRGNPSSWKAASKYWLCYHQTSGT